MDEIAVIGYVSQEMSPLSGQPYLKTDEDRCAAMLEEKRRAERGKLSRKARRTAAKVNPGDPTPLSFC